jgi:hypothetical protein
MHQPPMQSAEPNTHLELDVAWVLHVALDVHGAVAERGLGLLLCLLEQRQELLLLGGEAHAAAAAAGGGLDHEREADLLGDLHGHLVVVNEALAAGDGGDAGLWGGWGVGGSVQVW